MKKIFAIVLIIVSFMCTQVRAGGLLCLHYKNDSLTPATCQFLHDKFGFNSKSYSQYNGRQYSAIWLAGFGTPDGFWISPKGNNRISWGTLTAKYNAKILIADACYSGRIFDYNIPKGTTVITSTNGCSVSVNTPEKWSNDKYISTLASMLYCYFSKDESCSKYIGCAKNSFDPQVCQMSIILSNCAKEGYKNILLRVVKQWPKDHPNFSIGTVMINGKPWR